MSCKARQRSTTHHRNIPNQALADHTAQKLQLEYRIVLALWRMTIVENVQPVLPVPRAAQSIPDGVRNVGIRLARLVMICPTIPAAHTERTLPIASVISSSKKN